MAKKLADKPGEIDRETWHQILKAAEELFLAKGYRGVSVKEIADAVHVTAAALYYHFPQGKEDLFLTVIQVMFEQWTAGIGPAVASAHDVRERLHLLTSYLLTLPVDHFPALIQDAKEQIKDREKQQAIFRQLRGTFQQHILEILQQAIDAGEITADIPVNLLTNMYQGMVMGSVQYMHVATQDAECIDVSRIALLLVSTLLDGIVDTGHTAHFHTS